MKIIKRDGFIADFIPSKIATSIYNCAEDLSITLTEGDIKYIIRCTEKKLKELNREATQTSSYEVKGIVVKLLQENGFKEIAAEYIKK